MKRSITVLSLVCSVLVAFSQDTTKSVMPVTNITDTQAEPEQDNVSMFFGQAYSHFRFRTSEGAKDSTLGSDIRSCYGVSFSEFLTPEIFIRPELGYKNFGAVSILNNQKLEWSLHYLDLNVGVGYQFKFGPIQPYGGVAPYISYLYKASQSYGIYYYDLLKDDGIKKLDLGVNVFAGVKYAFAPTNSVFFEIKNATGLHQLEKNSLDGQSQHLFNRALSFQFGMLFNIAEKTKTSPF